MTTYDDFVSNFSDGFKEAETGKHNYASAHDALNRNARFVGYAEGWGAFEDGVNVFSESDMDYAAHDAWMAYNGE